MTKRAPNVAVVLSGCGYLDGAEIQESVSVLAHLGRVGATWHCFAPDLEQAHSVDHYTGEVEPRRQRIVMHESARIARGADHVSALADLDAAKFDALIIPGGFGVGRNLSTFAVDGADCEVLPEMTRAFKTFHATGKPIGMCCIAPVLAAKILGKAGGARGAASRWGVRTTRLRRRRRWARRWSPRGFWTWLWTSRTV
ncbi:MAG: isoprenoid biosynthesis glyoxalase ElbB [Phycisphaerales bacterium]